MSYKEIIDILSEAIQMPFGYLFSSRKRIYFLYLLTSAVLAFFVYKKTKEEGSFFKYLFKKEIWWSKSAWVDYGLVFFNALVKVALIGPYLIYGLYLAHYTNEFLLENLGHYDFGMSMWTTIIAYTFVLTLVSDFASFYVHYLMHKIPFLWQFHKVHHSATTLNPITQYRLHPLELILNNIKGILVFGLITGLFDFLSENQVQKWTFLGANAFSFLFLLWGANLRHSHVKLTYWNPLEYIFISPFQHQIHHSDAPKHFNKNMGSKLAIWDWMFGTLVRSKDTGDIAFGLGKYDNKRYDTFWKNLVAPFQWMYGKTKELMK
ncbi:sterol desaturase family protein [Sediminitomix flava]|uniref:Sterol desaturase/sphingolipid hydroxylase (Fatty acid hydroxylase superfamily) n=1 Tax=Sediminitomix flava TaxID=379075 RepID=A0A315Z767_SEDFL|nr:sterol desaturase family protein [Sediminitomix flava]PWJ39381.1 sterol desaturase/sphingolipid hydroxylase (fatty acid hydroxylase superfamily) [Sediminitomix flava]